MRVDVQLVSAFTDAEEGGNRAGVVFDADALAPAQKQAIAAKVGVSETAFVSHSPSAAFKLDFFTPTRQIAHCGHATIATFCLLRQSGRIGDGPTSKETIDGKRDILIEGSMAYMEQRAPIYAPLAASRRTFARALASLGIAPEALLPGMAPIVVNTGNSFLLVPLRDKGVVRGVNPDLAAIEHLSEQLDLIGYYVFSPQTEIGGRDAGARMFAPRYGIPEESATGTAAGPLACWLGDYLGIGKDTLLIEQGRLMAPPSPSVITVKLHRRDGKIEKLMVGGTARPLRLAPVEVS